MPGTGDARVDIGMPGTGDARVDIGMPGTGDVRVDIGMPGTGDARVDEAMARLGELADAPLDEHPVILGQIHDRLREVLGELGSAPPNGPGSPGTP